VKILLVSPFLPHPRVRHAGGKLIGFLHEELSRRHEVTLVTRWFPHELEALQTLLEEGLRVEALPALGPWFSGGPLMVARAILSYRNLVRLAERVAARERYDLCQVEFTETGYFWRPRRMPPAVLTCHDLVAKRVRRQGTGASAARSVLRQLASWSQVAAERRALRRFDRVLLLSQVEANWCRNLYPGVPSQVLRYPGGIGFRGLGREEVEGRVLFVGALGRPQNVENLLFLVRDVWPKVRAAVPSAELRVVGAGASEALGSELSRTVGANLVGEVENVESVYREASVFAAPILTGGGIIVKVLDALAAGVPVVTTPFGNEGVEAVPGREILVADSAEAFAHGIVSVLSDAALRRAIGDAGKLFVDAHFPPGGVLETLEEVYETLLRNTTVA